MRWLYRFGLCLGLDLVIAVFVLCVLFMALDPRAVAAGPKNEIRIVHPTKGAHIGQDPYPARSRSNTKKVFVFIDDKYFASGPPYSIFWNSAKVSNGPHRITVAAATSRISSNALFLASQSQTAQFLCTISQQRRRPQLTSLLRVHRQLHWAELFHPLLSTHRTPSTMGRIPPVRTIQRRRFRKLSTRATC